MFEALTYEYSVSDSLGGGRTVTGTYALGRDSIRFSLGRGWLQAAIYDTVWPRLWEVLRGSYAYHLVDSTLTSNQGDINAGFHYRFELVRQRNN
jgi:hypothetical protein